MKKTSKLLLIVGVFLAAFYVPFTNSRVQSAVMESLFMLQDYAQKHVLPCLVPAFFIAGAITVFISQASVMKYLGAKANKALAYGVASVSGAILAVCSCTVLPLFTGIYRRGAGLGPAVAFLYSGPAINVLAIILTARILGPEIGVARAVGAIAFAVVIGLLMQAIFGREEKARAASGTLFEQEAAEARPLWRTGSYFAAMIGILVFTNWARSEQEVGVWNSIFRAKWYITAIFAAALLYMLVRWFKKEELKEWSSATWDFAQQILPLLFGGVLVAGLLLGRPGHEGLTSSAWVAKLVGGNSLGANFFAAIAGAFMYFATLTEVPIVQGLLGSGMGQGPALALLLAGPCLSLPSMIVIGRILGWKKTVVYVSLVVAMATVTGVAFGALV